MTQLTTNFAFEEISPNVTRDKLSQIQMEMVIAMATTLQLIRNMLGVAMRISSGIRIDTDYARLVAAGYHPSESSDHYYGYPVTIQDPLKVYKFGKMYTYSVGAVDFRAPSLANDLVYEKIKAMVDAGKISVGQLIHEYGSGMDWLHISNDPRRFYSDRFVTQYLVKEKFLVSSDAGKTYQKYAAV
jgi:hypothetical protein